MIYKDGKIILNTTNKKFRNLFLKTYCIPITAVANLINAPVSKVKNDIQNGYLITVENENVVLKDKFFDEYLKNKGDTNRLKKFGYDVPNPMTNNYYGYKIKRIGKVNGVFKYKIYMPNGDTLDFESEDESEVFAKAKDYAFVEQGFCDNVPRHKLVRVWLTEDELFLFLKLLPRDKFRFTRYKLHFFLTLMKQRRNNERKDNNEI
ncbi:hypothetical protein [Caldisericum sp.]|uniref:hypothetical protein n=1 Tax=Caldisericum sp. TaxID=2499687 RepID=UPI003D0BD972